jgi:hypothetical protein
MQAKTEGKTTRDTGVCSFVLAPSSGLRLLYIHGAHYPAMHRIIVAGMLSCTSSGIKYVPPYSSVRTVQTSYLIMIALAAFISFQTATIIYTRDGKGRN